MVDVKKLIIDDKYGIKFLFITIEMNDMTRDYSDYKIDLYRSINQSAGFLLIKENVEDFRYKDTSVNLRNKDITYYYKVKITEVSTGEIKETEVYRYNLHEYDKWSFAIEAIEAKFVKDVIDNKIVYVLQKRRVGKKCSCYNPNRRTTDDENCPICYGTSIEKGYYSPEPITVNYYNAPSYTHEYIQRVDADNQSEIQLWTGPFPMIENEDILVDGKTRYIVTSNSRTFKNKYILRQILTLAKIPETNIIYDLDVI